MANETQDQATSGLGAIVTPPKSKTGFSVPGQVPLDPTETKSILANMQRIIDERESPLNLVLGGLKDALAYAAVDPTRNVVMRDEQKMREAQELMGMRTQMATVRAAQRQAELDQARLNTMMGGEGGEGAAGSTFSKLTPEAQTRVRNARNATEAMAIIDEDLKNQGIARGKGMFEAAGNKPEKYFIPGYGFQDLTPNQFLNLPEPLKAKIQQETFNRLGYIPGQTVAPAAAAPAAAAPAAAAPAAAAPAAAAPEVIKPKLKQAVFSIESSSGTADTTKPGIQGAVGPMQITPDTWTTNVNRGVIPKDLDINNPEHNKIAGEKILDYYYDKYNGDVDKTLAAYHGGEGAINKDGTINTERKDKLGTSIGDYISKAKANMGMATATAEVAPTTTRKAAPPPPAGTAPIIGSTQAAEELPAFTEPKPDPRKFASSAEYEGAKADWEKRRDAALEVAKNYQEKIGAKSAESFGEAEKRFVTLTDQPKLAQREQITNQLDAWMKRWGENPRVLEVLSKPTFANAVADALQQGVQMSAAGTISIPGIERILQSSMPGLKGEEVTALKQLNAIMGPRILQIVEQSKGSSSDKDWAAFTQIAGNANTGYDFLNKAVKYDRASLAADKADRALYNSYVKPGKAVDYRAFSADPKRNEIYDTYQKEVQNIASMQHERMKIPPRPANMPKNVPAKWSPSTNSYWIGDKQYKVE